MGNKGKLNIFDEEEQVIGQATRSDIHQEGLLHQEAHIWFYIPRNEIIFQHRAPDKDTYPDLLDATVGGHVEIGSNYEETAVKEAKEETGLDINPKDLILVKKKRRRGVDLMTKTINNCWSVVYAYKYPGRLEDLRVEEGKILNFEAWPIDKILNLTGEEKKLFIPAYFKGESDYIFPALKKIMESDN